MEKMAVGPPKSVTERWFQTTPMQLLSKVVVVSDLGKSRENSAGVE